MTQKDKDLLLKDLCARLPYGVKCKSKYFTNDTLSGIIIDEGETVFNFSVNNEGFITQLYISGFKPYLISLSNISEELKNFIRWKLTTPKYDSFDEESLEDLLSSNMQIVHYCYEHHLDINGLIERGLALEAPEGMYN